MSRGENVLIAMAIVFGLGETFIHAATLDARPAVGATTRIVDGKHSFVMSDGYATSLIHLTIWGEFYDLFARASVHLHSTKMLQLGPGYSVDKAKEAEVAAAIAKVIEQDKAGYVLLFLNVDPSPAWRKAHPEELVLQETTGRGDFGSFGSDQYRKAVLDNLASLGQFLRSSPLGKVVVGFHLCGAGDGQFITNGRIEATGTYNWRQLDTSPGNHADFRHWLREIYSNNIAQLRTAWGDPQVTFDNAALLKDSQIPSGKHLYLRDDLTPERHAIDVLRYLRAESLARLLNQFAECLKKGMGKPVIVMGWHADATSGDMCNIYGTSRILSNTSSMDALAATTDYDPARHLGRPGHFNGIWSTYGLHGRVRIMEWDHRPVGVAPCGEGDIVPKTDEEFRMQILREAGKTASYGICSWFYDMNNWYHTPCVERVVGEAAKIMAWAHSPHAPPATKEVAVFFDEASGWRKAVGDLGNADHWRVWYSVSDSQRPLIDVMATSGIPYDSYFLDDLLSDKLPDYKVYVLAHTPTIERRQIEAIKAKIQKAGKLLVIQEIDDTAIAGCGSADYCTATKQLRDTLTAGRHATWWVRGRIDATELYKKVRTAGVTTYGTPGQATFIGCGVATVHRITDAPTVVHFAQPVDLYELDGKTPIARGVTTWQPNIPVKQTAVALYKHSK